MKAIIMNGAKKSKVCEIDYPKIRENQLLVRLKYTGMCHSEMYPWSVAKGGERFGHEPVGVVSEVGKSVVGFRPGDRVTGLGAGYSEYIAMDAKTTVKIPDNLSDEDAVAEPLSCLLSTISRIPLDIPGESVAVVGAGYMGLGIISLLKLKGAGKIVAVDPREEARENALKFGACEVYSPDGLPGEYILNAEKFGFFFSSDNGFETDIFNTGFKTVVEFAGTQSALNLAGDMTSSHGILGVGGYHNDSDRIVDFKFWNEKAIDVINCHERRLDFQTQCCKKGLELLSSNLWSFKNTTTHIYSMDEFDKANEDMENKPKGYIKALVKCDL